MNKKIPGGHAKLSDISVIRKYQFITVEKRRNNCLEFYRFIFPAVYLLIVSPCTAQKLHREKGHCGLYYSSMADLLKHKQPELDFYKFIPGQTVASIGAQCCHWEAAFAAATDSISFYLEDIDTVYFNQKQAGFAWKYYDSLRGRTMTSTFKLITGTETATLLPEHSFDKIIIINSFHEFSTPGEMLADLKTKLRPGGILYIDETVPRKPGELHGVCKKPMYSADELNSILAENGFEPAGSLAISFRKGKTFRMIYAYKKTASPR